MTPELFLSLKYDNHQFQHRFFQDFVISHIQRSQNLTSIKPRATAIQIYFVASISNTDAWSNQLLTLFSGYRTPHPHTINANSKREETPPHVVFSFHWVFPIVPLLFSDLFLIPLLYPLLSLVPQVCIPG